MIEIESLSKNYHLHGKTIPALKNVSLFIEQGDIFGIIGLSGAGKSTLIRAIAHLIPPSSGKILFHGIDLATYTKQESRNFYRKIGMIFQHFNLLSSRTVEENIRYPLEITHLPREKQEERVTELLALVGLESRKNGYPSQLSGGEKQRVAIARALANKPELLLCDEATSSLDPKTTREILSLLKKINQQLGVTIVLITHEMEVIKLICNQVAVMEAGAIVEKGDLSSILIHPQHPTTKLFLHGVMENESQ